MKIAILTLLQAVLLLLFFFAGSLFAPFHIEHVLSSTPTATRVFLADGLLLMLFLFFLIVLVEVLTRRLRTAAPWTSLALLLAITFGLIMKFGFITRSAF